MEEQVTKRPVFLTVLCILTFVATGIGFISSIVSLIGGPQSQDEMEAANAELIQASEEMRASGLDGLADMMDKIQRMTDAFNDHFYSVGLLSIITILIGLAGALLMWTGKKLGFHLYIIYNIIGIVQIYLFVSPADIPSFVVIWNVIIASIFIFMYSRNLKWMK